MKSPKGKIPSFLSLYKNLARLGSNLETAYYICFEISVIPLSWTEQVTTVINVEKLNLCYTLKWHGEKKKSAISFEVCFCVCVDVSLYNILFQNCSIKALEITYRISFAKMLINIVGRKSNIEFHFHTYF